MWLFEGGPRADDRMSLPPRNPAASNIVLDALRPALSGAILTAAARSDSTLSTRTKRFGRYLLGRTFAASVLQPGEPDKIGRLYYLLALAGSCRHLALFSDNSVSLIFAVTMVGLARMTAWG